MTVAELIALLEDCDPEATVLFAHQPGWPLQFHVAGVAELRQLADGRRDLLAEQAGLLGGTWSVQPSADTGHRLVAAGLLVLAGSDLDLLEQWVSEGRRRAQAPMHTA